MSQDYTGITSRSWTEEREIDLADGETALVVRADGSLLIHIPGEMDAMSTFAQETVMLAAMLLSGTPMAETLFHQAVEIREQSLELASVAEEVPN